VHALRELVINPRDQQIAPLQWCVPSARSPSSSVMSNVLAVNRVFLWVDMLPEAHLCALFEQEFFPKWFHVLLAWLTTAPNFEEITQWYAPCTRESQRAFD
jgi:hypothetical protein